MPKKLEDLLNIGPQVASGLREIGIDTPEKLREIGAVEAFLRVRMTRPHWNNKMVLYALYGAINDVNCIHLPDEIKERLSSELNDAS